MSDRRTYISIDLGGTRIRAAACRSGTLVTPIRDIPTHNHRNADVILGDLSGLVLKVREEIDGSTSAIGLGIPTVLTADGTLAENDNIPGLIGFDLPGWLHTQTGLPVFAENDANCFAFGEYLYGAGERIDPLVCLTIGTGLGCGIIINGEIYRGFSGSAGEIWEAPARIIGSKSDETIEDFVSGTALETKYRRRTGNHVSCKEMDELARNGDPVAAALFSELGENLGRLCRLIASMMDPGRIVLGGSVMNSDDLFFSQILEHSRLDSSRLCIAKNPRESALLGAAYLAEQKVADR